VLALGDELEVQLVTAGGDTIGGRILGTINAAVLSARLAIGADGGVPLVAGVAIGGALDAVCPAPVGVDGDSSRDGRAVAVARAPGPPQRRGSLSGERAYLLGGGASHEGGEGSELGVHGEDLVEAGGS